MANRHPPYSFGFGTFAFRGAFRKMGLRWGPTKFGYFQHFGQGLKPFYGF
jgi:hypothetical protein